MEYARHEARMNAPPAGTSPDAKDVAPLRAHLAKMAAKGSVTAIKALEGPPFPEALDYLWRHAQALHGRCGASMGGLLPLNNQEIKAYRENMGLEFYPQEVEALMAIDSVLLYPGEETRDDG